ncbi:MAG: phage portal protein [Selenomonas ruminantium]|uniref:Phage portal protein n=1 Tax=Selenomonas ruminantium TaxID=971 RepID=A0A927ZTQ5_SELRU|nr:phage portal protein [Selenomonas ruminantium]
MSRRKRNIKARARMPTDSHKGESQAQFKNSGYSEGGASRTSNILKSYLPLRLSAKSDIDANLPLLRNRSADQAINTPVGAAAIQTSAIHTVGAGLKVFPRIRYLELGISHDEARAWQKKARREFDLWAASKHCDLYRRNNFYDLQDIAYESYLVDGDAFALFRRKAPTQYMPYSLRLQILEGNRISNPMDGSFPGALGPYSVEMISPETGNRIVSGVEIDTDGAVEAYWVCNKVQGDPVDIARLEKWVRVKAFGDLSGMPNIVQICHDLRSEQYRGIPYLAPVIETLKQVSRYTNAELTAAIIKSFFALFFTNNPTGSNEMPAPDAWAGEEGRDPNAPVVDVSEYGLGPGTLNALPAGVDVKAVDAGRSMSTFDPFVSQLIKQIGAAIGVPYEVIMKNFTSSYSASRAAMLQAWEEFKLRRTWFARDFCQPVYESWLTEAVAIGRIEAPGFFEDPALRAAWCHADWYGPTMSILDPVKDITGSALRVQYGLSTREREAAEMTGTDFEENLDQLAWEQARIRELGLPESNPEVLAGAMLGNNKGQGGGEENA